MRWRLPAAALVAGLFAGLFAHPVQAQRNLVPEPVELRLPGQPAQRLYGESHALVIGASKYTAGWSSLPGVAQDVPAVSALLRQQGFAVTEVNNPTRDQLDAALRNFAAGPGQQPSNRLLVYFAGHGHTLTTGAGSRLGYIVPVDAPRPDRDPGGFRRQAYSMESVEVIARQIESRHVLFLFDSCFSGTIFRSRSGVPDSISDKTSRPVRQFITAGDADQVVPDVSVFRRQLEAALRDGAGDLNRDGYITGTELGSFLEDTVTNYSRRSQTPRWGKIRDPDLDKGDFVFALAATPVQPTLPPPRASAVPAPPVVGSNLRDCPDCPTFDWEICGALQRGLKYGDYCRSWGGMLTDKGDLDKFYWMPEASSCVLKPPSASTGNVVAYSCFWNLPMEQAAHVRRTYERFRQQVRSCRGVRVAWDVENKRDLTTVELDFFDRAFAGRPRVSVITAGSDIAVHVRPGSTDGCR